MLHGGLRKNNTKVLITSLIHTNIKKVEKMGIVNTRLKKKKKLKLKLKPER